MSKYPLTLKSVESEEILRPQDRILHRETLEKIREISGENIFKCMQCGCCSAGCPVADEMGFAPAQMVKILQIGDFAKLKESKAVWMCASCFTCRARCPKGVDIARIAEAVRQIFLRKRLDYQDPAKIAGEKLKIVPQVALISCLRKFSS
ncbi:MAG: 4Fe-4S dicluster domain-containing protein [Candidatus Aminicenantes bacterium]|nr:4Fe-4S dicluster domain-containing protein [Candidatus Aminicenantes bacterium]